MKLSSIFSTGPVAISASLLGLAALAAAPGAAQSVSGRAYGAYVKTLLVSQPQSPLSVLPAISSPDGELATANADVLSVPDALSSDFVNTSTSGAISDAEAGAQSTASVADVSILDGLITAKELIANVTSSRSGSGAVSSANGSSFEDLTVAGVQLTVGDGTIAPNTRMSLPGVGYVVLNEERRTGDDVTSTGIVVNLIHVVLTDPLTGARTGDIIVGSASSSATF